MDAKVSLQLSGHAAAFPATPEAQASLRRYLDEARTQLREDPDGDEIVRDLEVSIGDRLVGLRDQGDPVTGTQMAAILSEVGAISPTRAQTPVHGATRGRFFCRITEGKWFGGICLGIAAYGEFRVDWVRTVVLLLTLFTGGILGLVYLVLLLVLPVVPTVREYEHRRDEPQSS